VFPRLPVLAGRTRGALLPLVSGRAVIPLLPGCALLPVVPGRTILPLFTVLAGRMLFALLPVLPRLLGLRDSLHFRCPFLFFLGKLETHVQAQKARLDLCLFRPDKTEEARGPLGEDLDVEFLPGDVEVPACLVDRFIDRLSFDFEDLHVSAPHAVGALLM
jgi:hypothetical protein